MRFIQYLHEAKASENMHLTHIEDTILYGVGAFTNSINILRNIATQMSGNTDSKASVSMKWDGSPAIICGIDPTDNRFFVGTKGAISSSSNRIKSLKDVTRLYDEKALQDIMSRCFNELKNLAWKPGTIIGGDLIIHPDCIRKVTYKNEPCFAFQPNTLTYIVPENSTIGKQIGSCSIGIVWHTQFTQTPEGKLNKSPLAKSFKLLGSSGKNSVFQTKAGISDFSGKILLTNKESESITKTLDSIYQWTTKNAEFLTTIQNNKPMQEALQKYIILSSNNKRLDKVQATKFYKWCVDEWFPNKWKTSDTIEKNKEFIKRHIINIQELFENFVDTLTVKNKLISVLNTLTGIDSFVEKTDGVFDVQASEGFVAIDSKKNMVKLVDRVNFSAANHLKNNA